MCPSSAQWSMSGWAPAYVFNWLSQRLFTLGCVFGAAESLVLSKEALKSKLRSVLVFSFGEEQASYLASSEYCSFFHRHSSVPAAGATFVAANKVPLPAQWCMQHARFSMGLNPSPCSVGATCIRLHPVLTRPFTDAQKASLRVLANIFKDKVQKDIFLAAVY